MKFIGKYMKKYWRTVVLVVLVKFAGTLVELLIPSVLEHLIDEVAPARNLGMLILWGCVMLLLAWTCRFLNIAANRKAVKVSADATLEIRRDLQQPCALLPPGSGAATGCTVYSGPDEATAIGNAVIQMLCFGEFSSLQQARADIARSFPVNTFPPKLQQSANFRQIPFGCR